MKYKKYEKVVTPNIHFSVAAVYEHHPFCSNYISEAVGHTVNTGIDEGTWCWVYYDWCGNPIGMSEDRPEGTVVDMFTAENLGCSFKYETDKKNYENLAEYLNKEPDTNE